MFSYNDRIIRVASLHRYEQQFHALILIPIGIPYYLCAALLETKAVIITTNERLQAVHISCPLTEIS